MLNSPRLDLLDKRTVRNYFMNADFTYWQRNTSLLVSNGAFEYVADRWGCGPGLDGVAGSQTTFSRSSDAPDTDVDYSLQLQGTYTPNEEISIIHRIEDIFAKDLSNGKVSLRFFYKSDGASSIKIRLEEAGTLNSFGGVNNIRYSNTIASVSDNTWQEVTIENIDMASCNNGLQLHLVFVIGATATITTTVSKPQLNSGSTIQEFSLFGRDTIEEFSYCERYAQKSYNVDVPLGTATVVGAPEFILAQQETGNEYRFPVYFKERMRVQPAITLWSISGTINSVTGSGAGDLSAGVGNPGQNGFVGAVPAGHALINGFSFHYFADAEL